MSDWRADGTASIVEATRSDAGSERSARLGRRRAEGGIMAADAWSNRNDMSTSSEERRRSEAALMRAIDADPNVSSPETFDAVCAYVDALASDGLLPEAAVIAFKTTLARVESLHRFEAEAREQLRSALVSACIQRYFGPRVADDVRPVGAPVLRLVRDDREQRQTSPDAPR
jgi:hypothetical protein